MCTSLIEFFKKFSTGEHGDKMRVDCINQCVGDKMKEANHNCLYQFYPRYILLRNDSAYSSYQDLKLCQYNWEANPEILNELVKMRNECELKCGPDCVNRHYKKLWKLTEQLPANYVLPLNTTRMMYFHNNMPDQITQHIEGMTFVDFFGNFGGLVGVWLGFSIATAISDLLIIIRDKYLKNFNIPI